MPCLHKGKSPQIQYCPCLVGTEQEFCVTDLWRWISWLKEHANGSDSNSLSLQCGQFARLSISQHWYDIGTSPTDIISPFITALLEIHFTCELLIWSTGMVVQVTTRHNPLKHHVLTSSMYFSKDLMFSRASGSWWITTTSFKGYWEKKKRNRNLTIQLPQIYPRVTKLLHIPKVWQEMWGVLTLTGMVFLSLITRPSSITDCKQETALSIFLSMSSSLD